MLNVTFEKQVRRKSSRKDGAAAPTERQDGSLDGTEEQCNGKVTDSSTANNHTSTNHPAHRRRVVSQSLHSSSVPIPTVTFADNRHIIPKSFMQPHPTLMDPEHRSKSDIATTATAHSELPPPSTDSNDVKYRPVLSNKHAASWGATTVNKQLRYQVFGEAFLQQPIPIQRHKKPALQHRSLAARNGASTLRSSNSEMNLKTSQQGEMALNTQQPEESIRRKAMKTAAERRNGLTPLTSTQSYLNEGGANGDEEEAEFDGKTGTSAPEPEIARSPGQGKRQRRYSSGGLRRKPAEVADDRGSLKYFEEADDAGYKGDIEDDVFAMDPEPSQGAEPLSTASKSYEGRFPKTRRTGIRFQR